MVSMSPMRIPGLCMGSVIWIRACMCNCVTAKQVYCPANDAHLCFLAHANAPLLSFIHWSLTGPSALSLPLRYAMSNIVVNKCPRYSRWLW